MQVRIDIGFDQLVQLVRQLPAKQWTRLKQEVEKQAPEDTEREKFRKLLLNGPVATKKQLETIEKNRKAINQWREK